MKTHASIPADSKDSFSRPPGIGQPKSQTCVSESPRPVEGLSRRLVLAGVASAAALPIAAAVPTAAPTMPTEPDSITPGQALDEQLVAAAAGLLAVDEAIDQRHRQHAASGADGDADEHPDYQALQKERDEHIATLITVPATSQAGIQAKATALRLRAMIEDYDQHQQIAVSLADDLIGGRR